MNQDARRQSFVERYVLARVASTNGTRADHSCLIAAANEAFDMIAPSITVTIKCEPRVHYKRRRPEMPRPDDRNANMLAERIRDAATVAGVEIRKYTSNPVNDGCVPALALARAMEFLKDA